MFENDRNTQTNIEQLAAELSDRLIPINQALNLISQRMEKRGMGLEVIHEQKLLKHLRGCVRSMALRLSEITGNCEALKPRFEFLSVNTIVNRVLAELQEELDQRFLLVKTDIPLEDTVLADSDLIAKAILILTRHAIRVSQFNTEILITVTVDSGFWDLEVADTGPGFTPGGSLEVGGSTNDDPGSLQELQRCLATVSQIAQAHGGSISLANCPQGGGAISMMIPGEPREQQKNIDEAA